MFVLFIARQQNENISYPIQFNIDEKHAYLIMAHGERELLK